MECIETSSYTAFTPDEGNVYISVNLSIKNIDKNSASFLSSFSIGKNFRAKLVFGDYEFSPTNLIGYSEDLHDTVLNPLSSKTGIIAFSVTKEITDLESFHLVLFNDNEKCTFLLS